jgi:hypothetical protein
MLLSTGQKGAIAESAIVLEAIRVGIDVYRPLVEGARADLVFGVGERLIRVQCKWAPLQRDSVVIRCYSSRRTAHGLRRWKYAAHEVDVIAAYCAELNRVFVLPSEIFDGRSQVNLRVVPTRNNQREGVNWADDFSFESLQSVSTQGP